MALQRKDKTGGEYSEKFLNRIRLVAWESRHAKNRCLTDFEIEVLNEVGEGERAKHTLKRRSGICLDGSKYIPGPTMCG